MQVAWGGGGLTGQQAPHERINLSVGLVRGIRPRILFGSIACFRPVSYSLPHLSSFFLLGWPTALLNHLRRYFVFQSYFYNDDVFNFNYAQAKAAVGNFKEAEEVAC